MTIIDEIVTLFRERGSGLYFGEAVTEMQHALQAAHLAESSGAATSLVVASLLHDIGHLLHELGEDVATRGIDARHEDGGAAWLTRHFGPEVVDPVRLHVAAKRYLCAVEPGYRAGLSPASEQSLMLQGGPMTPDEVAAFESEPHYRAAVALRRWDDGAKVRDLPVPDIEHYRPHLSAVVRSGMSA
jgi:phosphonate degradation associated HDIG domain protein